MNDVRPPATYDVRARRIAGNHADKLEQIDSAIQELLDIKLLECRSEQPGVRFLAVPRPRSHTFAMTVTILGLFILLVLLIGVRAGHAESAPAGAGAQGPPDVSAAAAWHLGG